MEIQCHQSETELCQRCEHKFRHTNFRLEPMSLALRSNYYPEPSEATRILQVMSLIDSHLESYEPEISRIQGILDALLDRKAQLQRFKECCGSVTSPIRKLPPEILQIIFLTCMGGKPDIIPVVGQICQHWRNITLDTPELWSNISVGRTRFVTNRKYHSLASLFLERSAKRPLLITLRQPANATLIELLAQHTERWKTLRLSCVQFSFYSSLALHAPSFNSLEALEILHQSTLDRQNIPSPVSLTRAPKLWRVILKDPLRFWELPWRQLTDVQYDTTLVQDGIDLLRKCSNIVKCSLGGLQQASAKEIDASIRLPHLESLRLAVDSATVVRQAHTIMTPFFARLSVPKLTSLELVGQWSPDEFVDFLTRNDCKLAHLSLATGYIKDEKIIQVLEALPLLQSLVLDADIGTSRQIQNRVITDKLLNRFILYPDSDGVLPTLEHLTLRTALNFEDQVLLDVISSRWEVWSTELYGIPVSRLTSVDFHFCGRRETLQPDTIEQLREFRAEGLRITLQQGQELIPLEA
ncbi:hypothetical protein C8F01DRAFT_85897 [Mycena amicta]|nr:hypothetical protein C8F01DRAFT_85897 [Mycena amicta]